MSKSNKGLKLPAEVYSDSELDRFFSTFKKTTVTGFRNHCIFMLALRAQLRCREVLTLRVSDVDTKNRAVTVLKGKGGKRRVVGIDAETARELDDWITARPHNAQGLLFASHKGSRLDTSYVRKLSARHAILGNIGKRVHVHGFRHSGACTLARRGVDVRIIQRQLGHSSLAVTDRYLNHLGANEVVETISAVVW
jgi:integrase